MYYKESSTRAFSSVGRASALHAGGPRFESSDPLPSRQKALTPLFLTDMHKWSERKSTEWRHASDLVRGAYFFAMRACEFCRTEKPGRTRRLTAANITFRGEDGSVIDHEDVDLVRKSHFVTVCFVDQKNGVRMEKRSQRRSGVPILCPIEAWGAVMRRLVEHFPERPRRNRVPVCSYTDRGKRFEVTASQVTTSQISNFTSNTYRYSVGGVMYSYPVGGITYFSSFSSLTLSSQCYEIPVSSNCAKCCISVHCVGTSKVYLKEDTKKLNHSIYKL